MAAATGPSLRDPPAIHMIGIAAGSMALLLLLAWGPTGNDSWWFLGLGAALFAGLVTGVVIADGRRHPTASTVAAGSVRS
ncbi:MAG: hypothetical protein L3K03_03720 [Thermoplasmata archaeon]|nr:hypothetical protein [Thermoplasmata archaeon]